jgi:hypothetical protein
MSEKKTVSRNVAIGLGIVCIMLGASSAGVFAYYSHLFNDKDETISSLNTQIAEKDYQIQIKNSQINNLQIQLNEVDSILALNESEVVYNTSKLEPPFNSGIDLPANFTSGFTLGMIGLDGDPHFGTYVGVALVQVSSDYDTYVTATFTTQGYNFTSQTHVGTNGTAAFVIAPSDDSDSGIDVTVYTQEAVIGATANITITYVY